MLRKNNNRICRLEEEVAELKNTIKKLTCKHENIEFAYSSAIYIGNKPNSYKKYCTDCNEVIDSYNTREELVRAQQQYYQSEIDKLKDKIEEVRQNGKG